MGLTISFGTKQAAASFSNWLITVKAPKSTDGFQELRTPKGLIMKKTLNITLLAEDLNNPSTEKSDSRNWPNVSFTLTVSNECIVDLANVTLSPLKASLLLLLLFLFHLVLFYLLLSNSSSFQHKIPVGSPRRVEFIVNVTNKDTTNCSSSIFNLGFNAGSMPKGTSATSPSLPLSHHPFPPTPLPLLRPSLL